MEEYKARQMDTTEGRKDPAKELNTKSKRECMKVVGEGRKDRSKKKNIKEIQAMG